MSQILKGKAVVILGATGVIGQGAAAACLKQGATVVAVGRSLERLNQLKQLLGGHKNLHLATGDFKSDAEAATVRDEVAKVLNGQSIDHLVSTLGFANSAKMGPTGSSRSELEEMLAGGLLNTFSAATAFLPDMKSHDGASYTVLSSAFAHACPAAHFWLATIKNGSTHALIRGLIAETAKDKVRVNGLSLAYPIAPHGERKNHFGFPASDTMASGELFPRLMTGTKKNQIFEIKSLADAEKYTF
eukprot:Partr_v1_DN28264_c0_g1_i1_m75158